MRGVPDSEAAALYYEVAGMPLSARRQRRDNTATPARTGRFRVTPVPISLTQVRRPLPNYLQQTVAAARQVQDWQEQSLRDLRAEGYEVTEVQDSLLIRSRDVHPGPHTADEYRAALQVCAQCGGAVRVCRVKHPDQPDPHLIHRRPTDHDVTRTTPPDQYRADYPADDARFFQEIYSHRRQAEADTESLRRLLFGNWTPADELQHRLNNPDATEQGAVDELAAALTPEYLRNLQTELDDLEEQDPEVADAMASYDRMVKDITGRVLKARFPRHQPQVESDPDE